MSVNNRLICAIDSADLEFSYNLVKELIGSIAIVKLGLEFFTAQGIKGVEYISTLGIPIFLDLKLHDIPHTVFKTLQVLKNLNLLMITIHLSGGKKMVNKALEGLEGSNTLLLGVTVLTSLSQEDLQLMGIKLSLENYLISLAKIGESQGISGIICSGEDLLFLREKFPLPFKLVVPGIRYDKDAEHKRSVDAATAIKRGADYIVVGRPITQSASPVNAAQAILNSMLQ